MAGETASALATIYAVQSTFVILSELQLTAYKYPSSTSIADGESRDVIIVGGGTAGCVLANRLSAIKTLSVLLIEAGDVAPFESEKTGLFSMLVNSTRDWNYETSNNKYTSQYLKNSISHLTAGKMLGGSSNLDHSLYETVRYGDYEVWKSQTNDSSWNYSNMLKYHKRIEKVFDKIVTNTSEYADYHGFDGPLKLTREPKKDNVPYIRSFLEMGDDYLHDPNANQSCGVGNPYMTIFDSQRQSSADAYLTPAKDRKNLEVMLNARVVKINFDSIKKATGVQVIDSSGTEITIGANKEIIITAGTIGTPHLLMLSGIGNKTNLETYNITTISDLPVGENLIDQPFSAVPFAMEEANTSTVAVNYGEIPLPATCTHKSFNNCSIRSDFELINLLFSVNSSAFLQMCGQVYSLTEDICDTIYEATYTRNLYLAVASLKHPKSRGRISLQSANYLDTPYIEHGIYSNDTDDLDNMAYYLQDLYKIVSTSYFKKVEAKLIDLKLSECADYDVTTINFWKCYGRCISGTSWQISSTCAVGPVLYNNFTLKGVSGVRVADASAMPNTVSGFIKPAVLALAEKAADIILSELA